MIIHLKFTSSDGDEEVGVDAVGLCVCTESSSFIAAASRSVSLLAGFSLAFVEDAHIAGGQKDDDDDDDDDVADDDPADDDDDDTEDCGCT